MSTPQRQEDIERINKAASDLGEFFDSVQIIATRYHNETDGTTRVSGGYGNWYARYGSTVEWVKIQDGEMVADEEEGGEE